MINEYLKLVNGKLGLTENESCKVIDFIKQLSDKESLETTKNRKVRPISPGDIDKLKTESIPDEIVESVNELIAKKWNGHSAKITQDEILEIALPKLFSDCHDNHKRRGEVFDNGWLDIEPIFRDAGWKVEYDKSGYNEAYTSFFKFWKK